jgi:hypothetical protein
MPNQEAVTVADAMVKGFFSRWGVPTFMHSDQGTQFEAGLFQEMCRLMGVKKTRTTPYRPQSDGQSERSIKTLTKMLAITTERQDEWDQHIELNLMAYRATPQESTGLSPNLLMLGREIALPVDVMCGLPPDHPREVTVYGHDLREQLEEAHSLARRHLRQAAVRQKRNYDTKVRGAPFQPGDLCWVANKAQRKGISPKLQGKWRGPGLITRVYGDVTVEVQLGAAKFVTVHTDMVKESHSPKRPAWMRATLQDLQLRQAEQQRAAQPQEATTQTDPAPPPLTPPAPEGGTPAVEAPPRPTITVQEDTPATGTTAPQALRRDTVATPQGQGQAAPPRPVPAPQQVPRPDSPPPQEQDTGNAPRGPTLAVSGQTPPVPAPRKQRPSPDTGATPPLTPSPAPLSQALCGIDPTVLRQLLLQAGLMGLTVHQQAAPSPQCGPLPGFQPQLNGPGLSAAAGRLDTMDGPSFY